MCPAVFILVKFHWSSLWPVLKSCCFYIFMDKCGHVALLSIVFCLGEIFYAVVATFLDCSKQNMLYKHNLGNSATSCVVYRSVVREFYCYMDGCGFWTVAGAIFVPPPHSFVSSWGIFHLHAKKRLVMIMTPRKMARGTDCCYTSELLLQMHIFNNSLFSSIKLASYVQNTRF